MVRAARAVDVHLDVPAELPRVLQAAVAGVAVRYEPRHLRNIVVAIYGVWVTTTYNIKLSLGLGKFGKCFG